METTPNPLGSIVPPSSRWKRGRPVTYRHKMPFSGGPSVPPSTEGSKSIVASSVLVSAQHRDSVTITQPKTTVYDKGDDSIVNTIQRLKLGDLDDVERHAQLSASHGCDLTPATPGSGRTTQFCSNSVESANTTTTDIRTMHSHHSGSTDSCSSSGTDEHDRSQTTDSTYVASQEQTDEASIVDDNPHNADDMEEEAEPHIPLTFQIPENLLRAAMSASPNTRASFWNTKLYRGAKGEQLSTHYCRSFEVSERVAQYFINEKVLGFDIEWKPFGSPKSIKQNASLIQLACEDRIALFHIAQFEGTTVEKLLPPTLKTILESPDIYKVGVAIKGDFNRLRKYLHIEPQGVFELSRLHNLVQWYATDPGKVTNKLSSLAAQVLQHLQLPLYKGSQLDEDPEDTENVRESDWSKPLDMQQIHYAAADAYAGFRLYDVLEWKRKQLRPTPPSPQLCDYDPVPRPRATKTKSSDATKLKKNSAELSKDEDLFEQEEEEISEEDEDLAYQTAPEDLIDSHQIEKAPSEPSTGSIRLGRFSLPLMPRPDPGYPTLPTYFDEQNEIEETIPNLASHSKSSLPRKTSSLDSIRLPQVGEAADDDEYADPELEEALENMYVDGDGHLRSIPLHESAGRAAPKEQKRSQAADSSVSTRSSPTASEPLVAPVTTHSCEYDLATAWAQEYLKSTIPSPASKAPSRIRATVPHLRAYHFWHEQHLSVDDISKHLRDPPLSHSTVTGYILQAIHLEKLEYDKEELKAVIMKMPTALRKGRWKWMAEKVGATG